LAKTAMALEEGLELEPLQEVTTETGDDFSDSETDSESDGEKEALGAKSCRKGSPFLHI
ncbi:CLC-B, partial [Symbiodinium sp. KB8]